MQFKKYKLLLIFFLEFIDSLAQLSVVKAPQIGSDSGGSAAEFINHLLCLPDQQWIFVVDNIPAGAGEWKSFKKIWTLAGGRILCISRLDAASCKLMLSSNNCVMPVPLPEAVAYQVFKDYVAFWNYGLAKDIQCPKFGTEFQSPLFIRLASSYLLQLHSSNTALHVNDLVKQLELVNFEVVDEVSADPVQVACTKLLTSLFRNKFFQSDDTAVEHAYHLAAIMSVMPGTGLPRSLFDSRTGQSFPINDSGSNLFSLVSDGSKLFTETDACKQAVRLLHKCGLLQRSSFDDHLVMQPVVQAAVRSLIKANAFQSKASSLGSVFLIVLFEKVTDDSSTWVRTKQLLPVAIHLGEQLVRSKSCLSSVEIKERIFACRFLTGVSAFIQKMSLVPLHPQVEDFLKYSLDLVQVLDSKHDTAHVLNQLGYFYLEKGTELQLAEGYLRRALDVCQTSASSSDDRKDAIEDVSQVVKSHSSLLSSFSHRFLALLVRSKGRDFYDEAGKHLLEALNLAEPVPVSNVVDILTDIGELLVEKGPDFYTEAERLLRKALQIESTVFQHLRFHPRIVKSKKKLAILLLKSGDSNLRSEALSLQVEANDMQALQDSGSENGA
jgi:hypothetical protein